MAGAVDITEVSGDEMGTLIGGQFQPIEHLSDVLLVGKLALVRFPVRGPYAQFRTKA